MCFKKILLPGAAGLLSFMAMAGNSHAVQVGKFKTHELIFTASTAPANPFDTYLLKLEITDPAGKKFTLDGFFDGNGTGGQTGKIWKARITPSMTGTWSWRTVQGDAPDSGLTGLAGQFECIESQDTGGVTSTQKHFRFQSGEYVYLQGDFLDGGGGLKQANGVFYSSHLFMSEVIPEWVRSTIISRQRDLFKSNKINVYFANKGDYGGQVPTTPWVGTAASNDKTRMSLARWKKYDQYIQSLKSSNMFAEMWFFADDSNFGALSAADKNRLFRYGMARTSAFSNTLYVIALEWGEGFTQSEVRAAGNFIQAHNPWERLISVHNHTDWAFSGDSWPGFIATQVGNVASASSTNALASSFRNIQSIPHLDEEYGFHYDSTSVSNFNRIRANLWANFAGGAAGGGTGDGLKAFMSFLSESRIPFQRMSSANSLVVNGGSTRFVLSENAHHYLVYSKSGAFTLTVSGTGLTGYWFNPRNPEAVLSSPFNVNPGNIVFTPPADTGKDWVLWVSDGTNLNSGVLHTTSNAVFTQEVISAGVNAPPTVSITSPSNNSTSTVGDQITISADATDTDGTITGVVFYDGQTRLYEIFTSPYQISWDTSLAATGVHTITAEATDSGGSTSVSGGITVTINQNPGKPVINGFSLSKSIVIKNTAVTYSISADDQDDSILNYSLDVDSDGVPEKTGALSSGSTLSYQYIFSQSGNFNSSVTVTDSLPQSTEQTIPITVVEPLSLGATGASALSGQTPLFVGFSGSSTGGIPPLSYSWDFGDGTGDPGPGNDLSHTYSQSGTYIATVSVTDKEGNSTTGQSVITVANPGTGLRVSNLTVNSAGAYEVVENGLINGAMVYTDRGYSYTTIPSSLQSRTYIKTANNDKSSSGTPFITFDISQDATVYIAYDNRSTTRPLWMNSFSSVGDILVTTDSTFSLYSKDFPSGNVTLGSNETLSMYQIVIVGKGSGSVQDTIPPYPPSGFNIK